MRRDSSRPGAAPSGGSSSRAPTRRIAGLRRAVPGQPPERQQDRAERLRQCDAGPRRGHAPWRGAGARRRLPAPERVLGSRREHRCPNAPRSDAGPAPPTPPSLPAHRHRRRGQARWTTTPCSPVSASSRQGSRAPTSPRDRRGSRSGRAAQLSRRDPQGPEGKVWPPPADALEVPIRPSSRPQLGPPRPLEIAAPSADHPAHAAGPDGPEVKVGPKTSASALGVPIRCSSRSLIATQLKPGLPNHVRRRADLTFLLCTRRTFSALRPQPMRQRIALMM